MPEEELTDDEVVNKLAEAMKGNVPSPEEKQNVFTFLTNVATTKDTSKTAYLRDDSTLNEVGIPKLPVRTFHSLALISKNIMNNDYFKKYFLDEAEIVSKTSLSRDGFLTKLGVLQRREIADITQKKQQKENKGWFKKSSSSQEQPVGYTPQ